MQDFTAREGEANGGILAKRRIRKGEGTPGGDVGKRPPRLLNMLNTQCLGRKKKNWTDEPGRKKLRH